MGIAKRIKDGRQRLGMTEAQFAAAVGISRGAVYQWEAGLTAPRRANAPRVAELLGITVSQLMSPEEDTSLTVVNLEAHAATGNLSSGASELGHLFDLIPPTDRISRAVAYNNATQEILKVLQRIGAKPNSGPVQGSD